MLDRKPQVALLLLLASITAVFQILSLRASLERNLHTFDDDAFVTHLDAQIPELMENYAIPGVGILLIRRGDELWSSAYGYADRETGRPLTTASIMMAHSISKSVTAWGVMKLVDEGRIGLDDPVERHLWSLSFPESGFSERDVTVRRLLSHSAGVPLGALGVHYSPGDPIPSLAESLSGREVRLVREPGSSFEYSNAGFAVLELLVEEITGRDFAAYMEEQILIPLGMRASSFAWREEMRSDVPTGYDLRDNPVPPFLYPNRASGGLFATLGDVGRFAAAGMLPLDGGADHPVLSRASIAELYTPQISLDGIYGLVADAYGLGHFLETLPSGHVAAWHGGQGLGWMTHIHFVPEQGDGIVILTNSQRSWPFIARILQDWSRWRGFDPVGMSRIVPAQAAMRTIIGWILLTSLWCAWRIGVGVRTGGRRASLRGGVAPRVRIAEVTISLALLGVLLWSVSREYLFTSSVFPDSADWLGASLLLLSVVLLASAVLPVVRR